jgi:hypothetical protein
MCRPWLRFYAVFRSWRLNREIFIGLWALGSGAMMEGWAKPKENLE